MKFNSVKAFQTGGQAPVNSTAPQGGEDPSAVLLQGAQQAVQNQDCQMAMQVCQMLIQALGGGSAQQEPQEATPAPAEGEPVYKKGGRLSRRIINK